MPKRFIFRQVCIQDIPVFFKDEEIRSKNHSNVQQCHQVSYQEIVERRNSKDLTLPCGSTVNDYVPFYFCPLTAFTYTISQGNVPIKSPDGIHLGVAKIEDRAFLVFDPLEVSKVCKIYFSDTAMNCAYREVNVSSNIEDLEDLINWSVFDDHPIKAAIPEIGYEGVCFYFKSTASNPLYAERSSQRMAEFLVYQAIPISLLKCIIVINEDAKNVTLAALRNAGIDATVYVKPECFFR